MGSKFKCVFLRFMHNTQFGHFFRLYQKVSSVFWNTHKLEKSGLVCHTFVFMLSLMVLFLIVGLCFYTEAKGSKRSCSVKHGGGDFRLPQHLLRQCS